MFTVTLSGSPNPSSRGTRIIEHAQHHLHPRKSTTQSYALSDFDPQALLYQQTQHEAYQRFHTDVARADGLIVITPIDNASFSGLLKVILDGLPQHALAGKPVLPLATAGNIGHLLALDYAVKPILAALKASPMMRGLVALDQQINLSQKQAAAFSTALQQRLETALNQLKPQPFRFFIPLVSRIRLGTAT